MLDAFAIYPQYEIFYLSEDDLGNHGDMENYESNFSPIRIDSRLFKLRHEAEILFVVSAGNDGVSIDNEPIYPASFDLSNMIVVTSSDSFGRLAPSSNYGVKNVDLMVPAERVDVIDHRGIHNTTGGSSFAAPRVAALAARFLRYRKNSSVHNIINFLKSRSKRLPESVVKYGWIPDPTDDYGF